MVERSRTAHGTGATWSYLIRVCLYCCWELALRVGGMLIDITKNCLVVSCSRYLPTPKGVKRAYCRTQTTKMVALGRSRRKYFQVRHSAFTFPVSVKKTSFEICLRGLVILSHVLHGIPCIYVYVYFACMYGLWCWD